MPRILVVDDDPDILETLEIALGGSHDVIAARDGLDALERLERAGSVDLVLLDLMMPHMSGSDLLRELRARGLAVPVILVSASHDVRAQAEQLHADGYVAKPFSLRALRDEIASVLARRS